MEKIPMTAGGYERLLTELQGLKNEERPAVIRAISEAREHGDLSENAEYAAARERQSFIEGRISELEDRLARAEVIDPSSLSGDTVKFGATVQVADCTNDEENRWQIVGEDEANIASGLISVSSPVARALIGRTVGDTVEVQTPKGRKEYEILDIGYQ